MSWVHVQDTPGANGVNATGSGTSQALTAFSSPITIGDQVIVFAFGSSTGTIVGSNVTVTDNGSTGNTYTQLVFKAAASGASVWVAIFASTITHNPSSGNLVCTIHSTVTSGIVGCAAEFSGGTLTTDGSNSALSSGTSPAPGNITTTQAADLILAVMTDTSGLNPETITGPASTNSVGIEKNGSSFDCGNGVYRIPGTTLTNYNPTWTLGDSVTWAAAQVALQASAVATNVPVKRRGRLAQKTSPTPGKPKRRRLVLTSTAPTAPGAFVRFAHRLPKSAPKKPPAPSPFHVRKHLPLAPPPRLKKRKTLLAKQLPPRKGVAIRHHGKLMPQPKILSRRRFLRARLPGPVRPKRGHIPAPSVVVPTVRIARRRRLGPPALPPQLHRWKRFSQRSTSLPPPPPPSTVDPRGTFGAGDWSVLEPHPEALRRYYRRRRDEEDLAVLFAVLDI